MTLLWTTITAHANILEMIQAVIAFVGMVFSIWALADAIKDSMALTMSGSNGPRRIIATGNVWTEVERLFIHLTLFCIGFASILLPPPNAVGEAVMPPELLQHTITRLGMILITILKVTGALRARYERTLFVRKMSLLGKSPKTPPCYLAPPPGQYSRNIPEIEDKRDIRKDFTAEAPGPRRQGE